MAEQPPQYETLRQKEGKDDEHEQLLSLQNYHVTIPVEEIKSLQHRIRKANKVTLQAAARRNVLAVGKTRSGKTTSIGVLKDPCYEPKEMSIFSDTFDPKFHSFSLDDLETLYKYTLGIIDTPGLKEVRAKGQESRNDKVIMRAIEYCLKNEITKIHALLIFISFELGVNSDDLDSFASFIKQFGHPDIKIALCITRAEDKSQKWKDDMVSQLRQHDYFSGILEQKNIEIKFIGCVDREKMQTTSSLEDLRRMYAHVYQMRLDLLRFIFSADKEVPLFHLPMAAGQKQSLLDLFDQQAKTLQHLENVKDWSVSQVQECVYEFSQNLEVILGCSSLLSDSELYNLFSQMKTHMSKVRCRMPQELRTQFDGRLEFPNLRVRPTLVPSFSSGSNNNVVRARIQSEEEDDAEDEESSSEDAAPTRPVSNRRPGSPSRTTNMPKHLVNVSTKGFLY